LARGVCGGNLDHFHGLVGEDLVERPSELGVTVADEEAELGDLATEIYDEVAGLLCCPCAVRVSGHAEDMHAPGRYLHDEKHVQAFEKDRVHVEEVAGQQTVGLSAQECPPGGVQMAGSGPVAPGTQDPPHGRLAGVVTETSKFPVRPAVSPGRVLLRQPQYQVPDFPGGTGAPWPIRVGPRTCDQVAMPGQQRPWRDQPLGS
jgi:hypothetical protein